VGIDSGDTDFDTVEEPGGAKTHTLTVDEMPAHTHKVGSTSLVTASGGNERKPEGTSDNTSSTGGGQAHNNLQPYIVVYFWKREN
jgi:microcystin-dependent protein